MPSRLQAFAERVTREMLADVDGAAAFGRHARGDESRARAVLEREVRALVTQAAGLNQGAFGVSLWFDLDEPAPPSRPIVDKHPDVPHCVHGIAAWGRARMKLTP